MRVCATNKSASVTGLYGGLLDVVLGPRVDAGGGFWLVIIAIAFAAPAYFFVFGIRREDMVGLWIVNPALLKRLALCCAGVVCICILAQIGFLIWDVGFQ
jgi:hypothetical protein